MLPAPSPASVVTAWTVEPVAIAVAAVTGTWYAWAARDRRPPHGWPRRRWVAFTAGIVAFVWTTSGFPGAYADRLFFMWTVQHLTLLLVVPFLLLLGAPVELAATRAPRGLIVRLLRTRIVRLMSSPLIGPALIPLLSAVLFFGPVAGWSITTKPFGWSLHLLVVAVGAVVMLPVLGVERPKNSLAAGVAMGVGTFELVLDVVPGALLRVRNDLATAWFDARAAAPWLPRPLDDQRLAASTLLVVGELVAVPFIVLVFRQWVRADARDAAEVDVVLEAERALHGPQDVPEEMVNDPPWWLSDPAVQQWLRRRR